MSDTFKIYSNILKSIMREMPLMLAFEVKDATGLMDLP